MNRLTRREHAAARELIAERASRIVASGPGRWNGCFENGKTVHAAAAIDGDWLRLEADPPRPVPVSLWPALARNAGLHGPVRFVIDAAGAMRVRTEILLIDQDALAERFEEVRAALVCALVGTNPCLRDSGAETDRDAARWVERLAGTGWPVTAGPGDVCSVDLGVERGSGHARIRDHTAGSVRVQALLGRTRRPSGVVRRALGRFLVTASGSLPWVRASARSDDDGGWALQFEVAFASEPSTTEMDVALGCLAQARRCFGREARRLTAEAVARAYLDLAEHAQGVTTTRVAKSDRVDRKEAGNRKRRVR